MHSHIVCYKLTLKCEWQITRGILYWVDIHIVDQICVYILIQFDDIDNELHLKAQT